MIGAAVSSFSHIAMSLFCAPDLPDVTSRPRIPKASIKARNRKPLRGRWETSLDNRNRFQVCSLRSMYKHGHCFSRPRMIEPHSMISIAHGLVRLTRSVTLIKENMTSQFVNILLSSSSQTSISFDELCNGRNLSGAKDKFSYCVYTIHKISSL